MAKWQLNGTDFDALKITGCVCTFNAGLSDSATLTFALDADAAAPLAADDAVTITHPTAGTYFAGIAEAPESVASGSQEVWTVKVFAATEGLNRITYKQPYACDGGPKYLSRCALGILTDGSRGTTADVITEILDFAATRGSGVTSGSILPGTSLIAPKVDIVDSSCLEAIRQILNWHPDATVVFDHSTGNVNIRRPTDMSGVTKACSGDGSGCTGVALRSARIRAVTGVNIAWWTTTTVDGTETVSIVEDTAGDLSGQRVLDYTVDLQGSNTTTQSQEVVTGEIPVAEGDVTEEWIEANFGELKAVAPVLITELAAPLTVVLSINQDINSDEKVGAGEIPTGAGDVPQFERYLISGSLPPWQGGLCAAPVTVLLELAYNGDAASNPDLYAKFDDGADKTKIWPLTLQGTNAETTTYRTSATTPGEDPIPGLAASLYAALGTEQPAGTASWVDVEVDPAVLPGVKLTLTGLHSLSGAIIQSVNADIFSGRINVTFGPMSGKLKPEQWVALQRGGQRSRPYSGTTGGARTSSDPHAATNVQGGTATRIASTPAAKSPAPSVKWFTIRMKSPGSVSVTEGRIFAPAVAEGPGHPVFPTYLLTSSGFNVDAIDIASLVTGDKIYCRILYGLFSTDTSTEGDGTSSGLILHNQWWQAKSATCVKGNSSLEWTWVADGDDKATFILLADIAINTELGTLSINQRTDGVITAPTLSASYFASEDYFDGGIIGHLPYVTPDVLETTLEDYVQKDELCDLVAMCPP